MANKLKVSYELNTADDNAKTAVENILKDSMDWVQIKETEWIVLANRQTAVTLQDKIKKILKNSEVSVKDVKKTKITNDGYIDARNGDASEALFTSKH